MARELRETTYQFRAPFVVDSSKFEHAFGSFDVTPHRAAIEQTVECFALGERDAYPAEPVRATVKRKRRRC
jgi:hypothetical protein